MMVENSIANAVSRLSVRRSVLARKKTFGGSSQFIIYMLHHPSSNSVYIGRSSKGTLRPKEHGEDWNLKKWPNYPVVRWIKKLRGKGLDYEIAILEECQAAEYLNAAEKFHIAYFKSLNVTMLNCTDGGEGIQGHRFSAEARAKMSKTRKGRASCVSPEGRLRISIANTGKKMSPDAIARTRAAHLGKKRSPETCEKLRLAHLGQVPSLEQRAKIGVATTRRWDKWREENGREKGVWKRHIAAKKCLPKMRINLISKVTV
jgi:hypothetical protein